jgi:hypothetical protein
MSIFMKNTMQIQTLNFGVSSDLVHIKPYTIKTRGSIVNVHVKTKDVMFFKKRYEVCRNPSLGFATKARACKNVGQEGSLRVTFHVPKSAKECEGMNPHTPKGAPTLGVGVPVDS